MTAYVAPSPPWRSPWSRAYVVFLWVVTWTSVLLDQRTQCGELNVASPHGLAVLRLERLSPVPTMAHRSERVLSTLTSTNAPSSPSPCQESTTTRLKRGWMRRPTRWPDDMRKLPQRPETATQETRSTRKRAKLRPHGTATPSWHQNASSDRRFRRSSTAERRRLSDWNALPDRRGNSERRWGTTYRSRVGRTSEADAYSPSLGRGPEGGGVDDFRVVPRGN